MSESHHYLCENIKILHDAVHGYMPLTRFATLLIDTSKFQRMRELKQLGTCVWVFPTGTHTRFEHSIGTYHIASVLLQTIISSTDPLSIDNYLASIPELQKYYEKIYQNQVHTLDEYICELIKIAAMCHDIGHGPFSHVFDDVFIPRVGKSKSKNATHEERSGLILEMLIKENSILSLVVTDDEIQFMKNLINPKSEHKEFVYQIVSNTLTGLDVDKFDYLARDIYMLNFQACVEPSRLVKEIKVIDNNIVYPEQAIDDIYNIFQTRFRLHKQVYCHKAVISVQFIIVELLMLLDDILHISDSIDDMNKFCDLTDEYIFDSLKVFKNIEYKFEGKQLENYNKALELVQRLKSRKLYATVYGVTTKNKLQLTDLPESIRNSENIIVFQNKIGFVSGNKPNPFDSILIYKTKDSTRISRKLDAIKKDKRDMTALLPSSYQEHLLMIYYKDKNDIANIDELKKELEIYFSNKHKDEDEELTLDKLKID